MVIKPRPLELNPFQQEALRHLAADKSRVDNDIWPEKKFVAFMALLTAALFAPLPSILDVKLVHLVAVWVSVTILFLMSYSSNLLLKLATPLAVTTPRRIKKLVKDRGELRRTALTMLVQVTSMVGIFWRGHVVAGIIFFFLLVGFWSVETSFRLKTLKTLERIGRRQMIDTGIETKYAVHWGPVMTSPALMDLAGINDDDMVEISNPENERVIYRRINEGPTVQFPNSKSTNGDPMLWINGFDALELQITPNSETLSVAVH